MTPTKTKETGQPESWASQLLCLNRRLMQGQQQPTTQCHCPFHSTYCTDPSGEPWRLLHVPSLWLTRVAPLPLCTTRSSLPHTVTRRTHETSPSILSCVSKRNLNPIHLQQPGTSPCVCSWSASPPNLPLSHFIIPFLRFYFKHAVGYSQT